MYSGASLTDMGLLLQPPWYSSSGHIWRDGWAYIRWTATHLLGNTSVFNFFFSLELWKGYSCGAIWFWLKHFSSQQIWRWQHSPKKGWWKASLQFMVEMCMLKEHMEVFDEYEKQAFCVYFYIKVSFIISWRVSLLFWQ